MSKQLLDSGLRIFNDVFCEIPAALPVAIDRQSPTVNFIFHFASWLHRRIARAFPTALSTPHSPPGVFQSDSPPSGFCLPPFHSIPGLPPAPPRLRPPRKCACHLPRLIQMPRENPAPRDRYVSGPPRHPCNSIPSPEGK